MVSHTNDITFPCLLFSFRESSSLTRLISYYCGTLMVFRYSSTSTGNDAAHSSLSAECILRKIGQPEEEAQDICVCSRKQLQTVPQITSTQVYSFSIYFTRPCQVSLPYQQKCQGHPFTCKTTSLVEKCLFILMPIRR